MKLGQITVLAALLCSIGCGNFSSRPTSQPGYVWLTRYDVKTLDPAAIQDWTTGKVLSYLYPSIGKLCESIDTSDNITFQLIVKRAKFTNGDSVTPQDVIFTLQRCLSAEVQSSVGNQFASQILGASEYMSGKSKMLSGVKVVFEDQLSITLNSPDVAFREKLSNSAFGLVNHKLVKLDQPISDYKLGYGAGNYKLVKFTPNSSWTLANKTTDERLTFRYVGDSATRRNLFDQGGVDYAMFAPHEINSVRGHKNIGKGGPSTLVYLQLNPKTLPALDRGTRTSLKSAVDTVDFGSLLGGAVEEPMFGFLTLSDTKPLTNVPTSPLAPPSKSKFEITFAEIGMQNPAVEGIITVLRKNGWNVQGRAMQSGAMLEKNSKGGIPILFTGWQPDFEGPLNTIPMLFHSKSSENHSGFNNLDVDRLIEKAQRGENTAQNIKRAEKLISFEVPGIPIYKQNDIVLVKSQPPQS